MRFESAETTLPLSVGWLVRTMVYSSGEETWELKDSDPTGTEEYHAQSQEFKPAVVKRIVFAEAK